MRLSPFPSIGIALFGASADPSRHRPQRNRDLPGANVRQRGRGDARRKRGDCRALLLPFPLPSPSPALRSTLLTFALEHSSLPLTVQDSLRHCRLLDRRPLPSLWRRARPRALLPLGRRRGRQRGPLRLCQAPADARPDAHGGAARDDRAGALRALPDRKAARDGRQPGRFGLPRDQVRQLFPLSPTLPFGVTLASNPRR